MEKINPDELELTERVVSINRVSKVVKGGKRFSFTALMVVGEGAGHVGFGLGKANEVPNAISKGIEQAKKNLIRIPLIEGTIPHEIMGKFGSAIVLMKPASEGTGVIAGGPVRALLESAGVKNVLTKCLGSSNPHNVIKAAMVGLRALKTKEEIAKKRSKTVEDISIAVSKG